MGGGGLLLPIMYFFSFIQISNKSWILNLLARYACMQGPTGPRIWDSWIIGERKNKSNKVPKTYVFCTTLQLHQYVETFTLLCVDMYVDPIFGEIDMIFRKPFIYLQDLQLPGSTSIFLWTISNIQYLPIPSSDLQSLSSTTSIFLEL